MLRGYLLVLLLWASAYSFQVQAQENRAAVLVGTDVEERSIQVQFSDVVEVKKTKRKRIQLAEKPKSSQDRDFRLQFDVDRDIDTENIEVHVNSNLLVEEAGQKGSSIKKIRRSGMDEKKRYERMVRLKSGENKIYVVWKENEKIHFSDTLIINYKERKRNLYVLSVGVSSYQDSRLNLNFADNDAIDFANQMELQNQIGDSLKLFNKVEVYQLIDEAATLQNIRKQIGLLEQKLNQEDLFVLFMSMHGDQPSVGGDYYLLPYDTDADIVSNSAMPMEWVNKQFEDFPCAVMQFVDACYSGNSTLKSAGKRTEILDDYMAYAGTGNVYCFASSSDTKKSAENPRWKNGAFTEALLDCLNGKTYRIEGNPIRPDTNGDGYLDVLEVGHYLETIVKYLTDGKQRPRMSLKGSGGGLPFFVY